MAVRRVPVVGRGDQDGVDFLHLEQLAVVGEVRARGRLLLGLVDLLAVDVADGDDIDRRLVPGTAPMSWRPRSPQPMTPS